MKKETRSSIDEYQRATQVFKNFRLLNRKLRERREAPLRERPEAPKSVYLIERPVNQKLIKEQFRALAAKLCAEHPAISTDVEVLGGRPHINNTRLSVGTVLGKLYLYGSVQAVLDIYKHLNEEQIKEAIAYAQSFLETACDSNEP